MTAWPANKIKHKYEACDGEVKQLGLDQNQTLKEESNWRTLNQRDALHRCLIETKSLIRKDGQLMITVT